VRVVLRARIRRRVEDDQGRFFLYDLDNDKQLQQAILRLARTLNLTPASVPAYSSFAMKAAPATKAVR
jgi:hypothetical protein